MVKQPEQSIFFGFYQYLSYSYSLNHFNMNLKVPKPVYRLILGVFLLSFVAASCGNKSSKDKKATEDTIKKKPVDGGN
jgi:hypothetical protein